MNHLIQHDVLMRGDSSRALILSYKNNINSTYIDTQNSFIEDKINVDKRQCGYTILSL